MLLRCCDSFVPSYRSKARVMPRAWRADARRAGRNSCGCSQFLGARYRFPRCVGDARCIAVTNACGGTKLARTLTATASAGDPMTVGFTPRDLERFREGSHCELHRVLGAHRMPLGDVRFAVWAPNAERVSVVGDFN